ncbi:hypothetical protein ACA910_009710 [Epithemia clementina (nom. ined.)]
MIVVVTAGSFDVPYYSPASSSASAAVGGKPQPPPLLSTPVKLTKETFPLALNDGHVWLFQFYAPWCGHCQKMAPVLHQAASELSGRLSIGLIDCTMEKPLCQEHGVRGYPTLKFSLGHQHSQQHPQQDNNNDEKQETTTGMVHDYTGGRHVSDLHRLAQRLNRPAVQVLESLEQLFVDQDDQTHNKEPPVVFLIHHPSVSQYAAASASSSSEADANEVATWMATTPLTQWFAQVARQYRASMDAKFVVFVGDRQPKTTTTTTMEEEKKETEGVEPEETKPRNQVIHNHPVDQATLRYLTSTLKIGGKTPFLCRVERFVPVRCLPVHMDPEAEDPNNNPTLSLDYVRTFVQHNVQPTVVAIGPHNFNILKKSTGRPLVIGIVGGGSGKKEDKDDMQQQQQMKHVLIELALATARVDRQALTTTTTTWRDLYTFGWMDGVRYSRFLQQFGISSSPAELPTLLVLDDAQGLFWYNRTSDYNVLEPGNAELLLRHIQDGTITPQPVQASQRSNLGLWSKLYWMIIDHQPWSVIFLVVLVLLLALSLTALVSGGGDDDDDERYEAEQRARRRRRREQQQQPAIPGTAPTDATAAAATTTTTVEEEEESKKSK